MLNHLDHMRESIPAPTASSSPSPISFSSLSDPIDPASLLETYGPLIARLASRYAATYGPFHMLEVSDLIQEGSLALLNLARHPHRLNGSSFAAYVNGAMTRAFGQAHALDRPIRVPARLYRQARSEDQLSLLLDPLRTLSLDVPVVRHDAEASTWAECVPAPPLLLSTPRMNRPLIWRTSLACPPQQTSPQ